MKRLLLDTNIYGLLVADPDLIRFKEEYQKKHQSYIIYGLSLVRRELRETPKSKTFLGRNLRIAMLSLYDELVSTHVLPVNERKCTHVAEEYYRVYRQLGGGFSKHALLPDYMIVACASLQGMDIVVSHDHATMLSDWSLKAYALVNEVLHLHNPSFQDYNDLKNLVLR